jgi:protein-S-isoprenylcysteine O-methyltransferase Ste14
MATSRSTPRLRLTALLLAGLLLLVAVSQRTAATGLAGQVVQLLGFACVACAALGRTWCSVFIAGYKDTLLVRSGPYAAVRHPLYALSMLAMLGLGLASRSVAITVGLLLVFAAIYRAASSVEDGRLRAEHGAAFDGYAAEVNAFLPQTTRYSVPESVTVRPRVLWKAFLDAGSLLGLWALLVLADALQLAGRTPTWITLP